MSYPDASQQCPDCPRVLTAIFLPHRRSIGLTTRLSHAESSIVSQIYLFQFTKTQNGLEPFGHLIRIGITCNDLNFQGNRSKGADKHKK